MQCEKCGVEVSPGHFFWKGTSEEDKVPICDACMVEELGDLPLVLALADCVE